MKHVMVVSVLGLLVAGNASAVVVAPSADASTLAAALLRPSGGIAIESGSESLIGNDNQQGTFTGFDQGPAGSKVTIADGVVLTTGTAEFSTTTNTSNAFSVSANTGSNSQLSSILSAAGLASSTFDQNVLSFSFTVLDMTADSIRGDFVFATDEFPTQSVTDVMGIFVNEVNYAFFPDGTLVSNQPGVNTGFFNSNPVGSTLYGLEWNGISNVLTFEAPVISGLNTFVLAIADTSDQLYDSAVFFSGLRAATGTGGGGGIIDDPDVTPIPLPASFWLLGAGLVALGRCRKRMAG